MVKHSCLRNADESGNPAWFSPGVCSLPPLALNICLLPASPPHSWFLRTLHSQLVPVRTLLASTSHFPHSPSSRYQLPFNLQVIFFLRPVLSISNAKARRDLCEHAYSVVGRLRPRERKRPVQGNRANQGIARNPAALTHILGFTYGRSHCGLPPG